MKGRKRCQKQEFPGIKTITWVRMNESQWYCSTRYITKGRLELIFVLLLSAHLSRQDILWYTSVCLSVLRALHNNSKCFDQFLWTLVNYLFLFLWAQFGFLEIHAFSYLSSGTWMSDFIFFWKELKNLCSNVNEALVNYLFIFM